MDKDQQIAELTTKLAEAELAQATADNAALNLLNGITQQAAGKADSGEGEMNQGESLFALTKTLLNSLPQAVHFGEFATQAQAAEHETAMMQLAEKAKEAEEKLAQLSAQNGELQAEIAELKTQNSEFAEKFAQLEKQESQHYTQIPAQTGGNALNVELADC